MADPSSQSPIRTAGDYNLAQPSFSDGDRAPLQMDSRGNTRVAIHGGNSEGTALASASRTVATVSADITNTSSRGVYVWLDITLDPALAIITCHIQSKDPASGVYTDILTGATKNGVGNTSMTIYPGITTSANTLVNNVLPRIWRISITVNDSDAMTYSVGFALIL